MNNYTVRGPYRRRRRIWPKAARALSWEAALAAAQQEKRNAQSADLVGQHVDAAAAPAPAINCYH